MAIDIKSELEKRLQQSNQNEMSLSERLNQLDKFNSDVAVPQISSEGPKGYNPMNSLQALFNMISNRKSVASDLSSERDAGFNLLQGLSNYEKQNQPDTVDPIKLLELQLKAKEQGLKFDPETMSLVEDKSKPKATQDVLDVANKLFNSKTGEISGIPNIKSLIPGSSTQLTKNYYDQLKSMLALENRQKLKGSGQISDYESKVLDKAASALGKNLSDSDFRKVLEELIVGLQGDGTKINNEEIKKKLDPLGLL